MTARALRIAIPFATLVAAGVACVTEPSSGLVDAGATCSVQPAPAPDGGGGFCCPTSSGSIGPSGQCGGKKGGWSPTANGCCDLIHGSRPDEPLTPAIDEHGCAVLLVNQGGCCLCRPDASVPDASDGSVNGDAGDASTE